MDILVEKAQGKVPVTILGLKGDLDASNFQEVIKKVTDIFTLGVCDLLLDMSQLKFLSSSGIVALHSIALIMRGDRPHDLDKGWSAFHAVREDQSSGKQEHIKLFNPAPKIQETLHKTGMDDFFEIFHDWNTALASF
jgi:anti-anti-sigma regulatory factor